MAAVKAAPIMGAAERCNQEGALIQNQAATLGMRSVPLLSQPHAPLDRALFAYFALVTLATAALGEAQIVERWIGIYPSSPDVPCLAHAPDEATRVVSAARLTCGRTAPIAAPAP